MRLKNSNNTGYKKMIPLHFNIILPYSENIVIRSMSLYVFSISLFSSSTSSPSLFELTPLLPDLGGVSSQDIA